LTGTCYDARCLVRRPVYLAETPELQCGARMEILSEVLKAWAAEPFSHRVTLFVPAETPDYGSALSPMFALTSCSSSRPSFLRSSDR
jgi:hypothetical protein